MWNRRWWSNTNTPFRKNWRRKPKSRRTRWHGLHGLPVGILFTPRPPSRSRCLWRSRMVLSGRTHPPLHRKQQHARRGPRFHPGSWQKWRDTIILWSENNFTPSFKIKIVQIREGSARFHFGIYIDIYMKCTFVGINMYIITKNYKFKSFDMIYRVSSYLCLHIPWGRPGLTAWRIGM